jgi:hypothetical protein
MNIIDDAATHAAQKVRARAQWAIALTMLVGCGGGSNNGNGGGDSGATEAASAMDSGTRAGDSSAATDSADASSDADANDGAPPVGAVPPNGIQLVKSSTVTMVGVTSDGYAIYMDNKSNAVSAIGLTAGSTPIVVSAGSASSFQYVSGPVVLYWTALDMKEVGTLSSWTKAHGSQTISTSAIASFGTYAVSADGSNVLYFDGIDETTLAGTVTVASTATGAKTALLPSVSVTGCFGQLAFGGTTAIVSHCTAPDGGAGPSTAISSFTGPSWAQVTVAENVRQAFTVDDAGAQVLVTGAASLAAYPVGGGAAKVIDTVAGVGAFSADGTSVAYTTPTSELKRSEIATPAPIKLASGLAGLLGLSPDANWALAYLTRDPNTGNSDLYLASAATPGAPTTLASMVSATVLGDAFTADSSHALFYANFDTSTLLGTFSSVSTSGGATTAYSQTASISYATSGAKALYNDNYNPNVGLLGTADIHAVDTSKSAAPTLLVSQADMYFYPTAAKDRIVYSWSYDMGPSSGVWVLGVP